MEERIRIRKVERQMFVLGMTASSLAEKTGLSKVTISNILLGKQLPSPESSMLIAEALSMEVTDFRAAIYDAKSA